MKILVNFPSNIGDTIMALPGIDLLKSNYPQGRISAIVSERTQDFLSFNNFIDETILYCKNWNIKRKIKFISTLKKNYDLMVDFKNSFLPVLLGIKRRTPFIRNFPSHLHAKDRYLNLVKGLVEDKSIRTRSEFLITPEVADGWDKYNLSPSIFISTASRSSLKTYPRENLEKVVAGLNGRYPLVIIGEDNDRSYYGDIFQRYDVVDLVGRTTMLDIYYLLKKYALLVLSVDSSILHLASYLNKKIVAIFGPTSPYEYGPWSERNIFLVNERISCRPCRGSSCRYNLECIASISAENIIHAINYLLNS